MPLLVREYEDAARDSTGASVATGQEPAHTGQSVTVGSESTAFHGKTRFLRLYAEEAVRLAFGNAPSAGASSTFYMAAGQTEFVGVKPGHKLDTAAG